VEGKVSTQKKIKQIQNNRIGTQGNIEDLRVHPAICNLANVFGLPVDIINTAVVLASDKHD